MRKKEKQLVISFETTTMALLMEKMCKEQEMPGRLIPLPPVISAGCGLAWQAGHWEMEVWEDFMKAKNIQFDAMRFVEI